MPLVIPHNNALFDITSPHPGTILREFLDRKGWSQEELATITNRSRQNINEIISGKSGITPDMAIALAAAFGNTATEWLKWDSQFRLSNVERDVLDIRRKARFFEIAPIREMQ